MKGQLYSSRIEIAVLFRSTGHSICASQLICGIYLSFLQSVRGHCYSGSVHARVAGSCPHKSSGKWAAMYRRNQRWPINARLSLNWRRPLCGHQTSKGFGRWRGQVVSNVVIGDAFYVTLRLVIIGWLLRAPATCNQGVPFTCPCDL